MAQKKRRSILRTGAITIKMSLQRGRGRLSTPTDREWNKDFYINLRQIRKVSLQSHVVALNRDSA